MLSSKEFTLIPLARALLVNIVLFTMLLGLACGRNSASREPNRNTLRAAVAEFYLLTLNCLDPRVAYEDVGETFGCLFRIDDVGPYNEEKQFWPVKAALDLDSDEARSFCVKAQLECLRLRASCEMMPLVCSPLAYAVYRDENGEWKACWKKDMAGATDSVPVEKPR